MHLIIKGYEKTTKNGKKVILPVAINAENDSEAFFVADGFSFTLQVDDEQVQRLVESGKLNRVNRLERRRNAQSSSGDEQ
jgi:hypothetical protein